MTITAVNATAVSAEIEWQTEVTERRKGITMPITRRQWQNYGFAAIIMGLVCGKRQFGIAYLSL